MIDEEKKQKQLDFSSFVHGPLVEVHTLDPALPLSEAVRKVLKHDRRSKKTTDSRLPKDFLV